jgi:integration host factor subunit beta
MIRSDLVASVAKANPGLTLREIDRIVDQFFDSITEQLASGGRVEIRGFGAFSVREREGRVGRNPRTGDSVSVAPKRVPYFKPGKEVRERLNQG